MAEVKWIKLTVGMFDNPKIKYIRKLPEGNNLVLIWVMLLSKAGVCNSNGFIYLTENIPYSVDMLASEFDFDINTIKFALQTFNKLNMIEVNEDDVIYIANWEEYQNTGELERIREQNRIRKRNQRERDRLKLEFKNQCHVTENVTVTQSHATDIDIDIDIDKEIKNNNKQTSFASDIKISRTDIQKIIQKWNSIPSLSKITKVTETSTRHKLLKARIKEHTVENILVAIDKINQSDFLQGKNDKGWVITFDWFLKPNNFIKVLEGNYNNRSNTQSVQQVASAPKSKNPNFTTTYSHNWDLAELEKREREYVEKMYGN